jgi:hypothetical protein
VQKNQNLLIIIIITTATVRKPIVEIPYGVAVDIGELLWRRLLAQSVPIIDVM